MTWKTFAQAVFLVLLLCAGIYTVLLIRENQQKAEVREAFEKIFPQPRFSQEQMNRHIDACKRQGYRGGALGC